MKIEQSYEQFDIRVAPVLRTSGSAPAPRSTGVWHVSTLIRYNAISMGLLNDSDLDEDIEFQVQAMAEQESEGKSQLLTRIALGLAWEDWLGARLAASIPGLTYHPGEIEQDGVYGSPDALHFIPIPNFWDQTRSPIVAPTIHEFKLTWNEAGLPITRKWYWLAQLKAYCKIMGTTRAVLHVNHVNGFLRAQSGNKRTKAALPLALRYDIQFTQEELDGTWKTLLNTRNQLELEGVSPS